VSGSSVAKHGFGKMCVEGKAADEKHRAWGRKVVGNTRPSQRGVHGSVLKEPEKWGRERKHIRNQVRKKKEAND